MKKIILMSLAASALLFSSCNKDYLATKPTDSVTPPVIFSNLKGAELAVRGMYTRTARQYDNQACNGESNFAIDDDLLGGLIVKVNRGNGWFDRVFNYSDISANGSTFVYFQWRQAYRYAKNANEILDKIDEIPAMTDIELATRAYIKAETMVFRAYAHYRVAQRYALRYKPGQVNDQLSVPIKTTLDSKPIPRETLEKVYNFCIEELDAAIAIFDGEASTYTPNRLYRMNKYAAHVIKSRIFMIRGQWELALAEAEKIITPGNYSIMGPSGMIGTWMANSVRGGNVETIWGTEITAESYLNFYSFYMFLGGNNSTFTRTGAMAIDRRVFDAIPTTDYRKNLYLQDDAATISANNNASAGRYYFDGVGAATYGPFGATPASGSSPTTYIPLMSRKFQTFDKSTISSGDFTLMRYAEVLYIAAEAAYMSGNMSKAKKYLEDANKPYDASFVAKSGADLLKQIIDYKSFDLWGEGRSYEDLIRRNGVVDRTYPGYNGNLTLAIVERASVQDNPKYFKYTVPKTEIQNSQGIVQEDPVID